MASTTVETISAAIELIDTKKENIKKAFDELQSHSAAFNLSWSDLDSHFSSIQTSLTQKLHLLQSLHSQSNSTNPPSHNPSSSSCQVPKYPSSPSNLPTQMAEDPFPSSLTTTQVAEDPETPTQMTRDQTFSSVSSNSLTQMAEDPSSSSLTPTQVAKDPEKETQIPKVLPFSSVSTTQIARDPSSSSNPSTQDADEPGSTCELDAVPPRPELVAFCERMDAMGLRNYMKDTLNSRNTIRGELLGAIRHAKDPAAMVLNAMDGFYSENGRKKSDKDPEVFGVRRSGVLLLEVLMGVSPNVGLEVRERAKKLAMEWKGKVSMDGENPFEVLGFLHLVAAYGLESEFNREELVDHFVIIARYRQAIDLCRTIGLGDNLADLIQKLVSKGKHLLAVKFISEFGLTDKFPPVPLLKSYVKESKKLAKEVCKDGNNSRKSVNEAAAKETGALKSVIKVIEDLKFESEYPPAFLRKRLEQLEKEKANRKRNAEAPAVKPLQVQQQKQQTAKQLAKKLKQQQQYGTKRPRMTPPAGSAAVSNSVNAAGLLPAYAFSGTAPAIPPYAGSSAGLYDFAGGQMGLSGNPGPASSHLYSSKQYVPPGYYNRQTAYGGYGVPPEYNPSYYPQ